MLTPKSQVTSSQSTARRGKGSSVQLIASNESNQKICTGSPKVEKIVKASQKLLSPNQKADVALTNRIGSHRSRREKSESTSTIPLHSRNNTCTNYSISVRNSSVKSQTDSVLEKIIPTVTSKINQTDHLGNLHNLGAQKNEKASITIDLKDIYDNETLETTQSAIKSQTLSSPQASIKPRDFIKAEKRSPCKENNFRFNSVVSPRTCSARKSPLRSVRNSNRIGLNSMMAAKTPTKNLGCHKKSLSLQETIVSSLVNKGGDFPLDLGSALSQYGNQLSIFEKQEISKYPEIYYISDRYHKIQARQEKDFDDDKGDYLVVKNDHICYRYEIVEMLGRGSFGQVLKVYDHKQKEYVALKIIRSQKKFHFQAKIEIDILQYMMSHQGSDYNIMGLKDSFSFRNHVCLVFELMSLSLYDFLKKNKFKGFNINVIRKFAIQILYALKFLSHHKLIHCDLKPENILLKHSNKTGIKIIDFGSSCFESEKLYTYIQSRFYRAPEVILGLTYSSQIDMWSFGCLLYELYVGQPIFPGESEQDQLLCMMEILGAPDKAFIAKSSRKQVFFDDEYNPRITPNSKGKKRFPNIVSLETMIQCEDKSFLDLIKRCLVYDPKERFTPAEALAHEWILGGLPPDLQAQHIKLVESSPEKKASVRVKEEILNPLYAKQHLQLESNRSIKMDTEPNYSNWKSPKSKAQADINDSEISIKEVRSAEKPKKSDDLFEKKPSVSHFPKKKINLNPKQSSEEDSIINVTINLNDTSKDLSIHNYPSKKTHKKSGSMAGSTHRRNDSQSLINNYVSANAATHRSTNRSSGQENQGVSRENKIKRGSHIRDIRIIEEPHESSNFKSIVEEIPSLSTTNTISLSNIFTGDNTKINGPLRDSATFNPSFNKKAVYSGNSMADANSSVETHIQKVTHSSLGSNPGVSTPSHSQIAGSVNCYQQSLSSNKLVDNIGTHSLISKGSSNSINGDVNNNIELYKSINSPSQSRRSQGNIKGESIYSNAQIRRFNISECFSMKFKLESSKYSTANTNATQPEFSNRMNTSNNLNNSALKSPQSNRLGDRNCQKSVLTEKKLNSPSQPNQKNYSPKNSEFLSSNGSIGTKQDVVNSISPRDISFAKLKYPISRKK